MKNNNAAKPADRSMTEPLDSGASNLTIAPAKASSVQMVKSTVKTGPLDAKDQKLLAECETDISLNLKGWCVVGFRLWQIREHNLYRTPENRSFEAYLAEKWDYSKAHANRLIKAHLCVTHLAEVKDEDVYIPSKESEVRYISNLTPEKQIEVACEVKTIIGNKRATAEDFKTAREKLFPLPIRKVTPTQPVNEASAAKNEDATPEVVLTVDFGSNLVPFSKLKELADKAYNFCGTKSQDALKLIGKLQKHLEEWADWQAENVKPEPINKGTN
jgi:hypothetical protein